MLDKGTICVKPISTCHELKNIFDPIHCLMDFCGIFCKIPTPKTVNDKSVRLAPVVEKLGINARSTNESCGLVYNCWNGSGTY